MTSSQSVEMEESFDVLSEFKEDSELEHHDDINVDYDFFDRVSSQLYRNPRRAVEELVCNSYDAGAWECHVVTPEDETERLYVLDNGVSMSLDGINDLWKIADSPKKELDENPDEERFQHGRQQIGKFGIGKLAAFAVGQKLTHVATKEGRTRVVTVAKQDIEGRDTNNPPKIEVFGLDEDDAEEYIKDEFIEDGLPNPWQKDGKEWEDWTLAVVDDIKPQIFEGGAFGRQYLAPMIRTAIPLSTDFEIYLNGQEIETRDPPSDTIADTDIGDSQDFKKHLENDIQGFWVESGQYADDSAVPQEKYECEFTSIDPYEDGQEEMDALDIPIIGPVSGEAAIYKETLTTTTREKKDVQDYGYRILVRGKLVNRGEPLFDTPAKSHKYWNRFFAEIEIPKLDESILLQRDSIEEHGNEPRIARTFLDSLFNYLRNEAQGVLESDYDPGAFFKRLSTLSPHKAPEALQGLVDAEGGEYPTSGWESVDVEFGELGKKKQLSKYDAESESLKINLDHPLLKALHEKRFPETSREVVGEALAGHLLASGWLHANNVEQHLIEGANEIMELSARSAAKLLQEEPDYYITKLEDTVEDGGDPFERAVVDAFENLGASAEHIGGNNNPDAVVELSLASQTFRASIEAKGGDKTNVDHGETVVSTMRRHKEQEDCDIAVLISKYEYLQLRGPESEESDSGLLDELNDYDDTALLTINALGKMLKLHQEFPFDYSQLKHILENRATFGEETKVELTNVSSEGKIFHDTSEQGTPLLAVEDLPELVDEWWTSLPRDETTVETILQTAKAKQKAAGDIEDGPDIGFVAGDEKLLGQGISKADVEAVLASAELTGLVRLNDNGEYNIRQSVNTIMQQMRT